jgi:hypothetical protein
MDYPTVRKQKLQQIVNQYSQTLSDYIMLYNQFLQNPQAVSQADISNKNNQLIQIIQQLNANNEFTAAEVDSIFNGTDYGKIFTQSSALQSQVESIKSKNVNLSSTQQLLLQLQTGYRRHRISYYISLVIMVLLLVGVVFLVMKAYQSGVLSEVKDVVKKSSSSFVDFVKTTSQQKRV